jgi:autotransporter-associated beta strand protein
LSANATANETAEASNIGMANSLGLPSAALGIIDLGSTTTTGELSYVGTGGATTNQVVNLLGTTGGGILDQSGTGNLDFTSNFTATGAGIKTLTLQGSTAGTGEIDGAIVNGTSATAATKAGSGTWTLAGANTFTGATTISAGTLQLGGSVASTSIVDTAALVFNSSGAQSNSAVIGGSGTVTQAGTGTLTLAGANTYTGTTTINSGTLALSGSSASTSIVDNAALVFNGSGAQNISAVISGSGTVTQAGTGALTLAGANTFTGGLTLTSGTLDINSTTALGAAASPFTINGGTIDTSDAVGALVNNNPITLGANFTYGGTSNLNLGTGAITNAGNYTITLNGTAKTLTLGGTMTNTEAANQTTTVNGAGNTFSLGTYALSNNANNYNDVLNGNGNITITGAVTNGIGGSTNSTLTYTGTGTYTPPPGSPITWANASGHTNWNDPAAWVGGVVPGASNLAIFPSAATVVAPILTANASVAGVSFDDSSAPYSLTQSGGTWTLTVGSQGIALGNTSATAETTTLTPNLALAVAQTFITTDSSAATTLTVSGAIGGAYNLTTSGNGNITCSGAITTGTGSLTDAGTGTLTLGGANTFTGGLFLNSGTLDVSAATNLAAGGITFNGGALGIAGSTFTIGSSNPIAVNAGGGRIFATSASLAATIAANISGSGALTVYENGYNIGAIFSGNNSGFSGGITNGAGYNPSLEFDGATSTGTGPITFTASNATTLTFRSNTSATFAASGITFNVNPSVVIDADPITSGTGQILTLPALTSDPNAGGYATFGFTSANGYTVSVPTFYNDAYGATLSPTTANVAITTAAGNASAPYGLTLAGTATGNTIGAIGGSGVVTVSSGTWTLTGTSSYTGVTTISAGTLQLGGSVASTSIVDNAALVFNSSGAQSNSAVIGGSGTVTQAGTGTLTLAGANTYTGTTTVSAGTLQVSGSVASTSIVDNAALVFNSSGAQSTAAVISGSGTVTQAGTGTLTLAGANTYTGTTTVSAGTLQLSGSVASTSIVDNAALVFNSSGAQNNSAVISGSGTVTQAGTGTLTLAGADTYTGATTISAGTLQVSGSVASTSIVDNAALVFNSSGAQSTAAAISGSGSVTQAGTGTLTLAGVNTFTGGLNIQNGTVKTGSATGVGAGTVTLGSGSNGSGTLDLNGQTETILGLATSGTGTQTIGNSSTSAAATLNYTGATTSTFGGVIKNVLGSGTQTTAVTVNNAGAKLTLAGADTYTGATTISAGTLLVTGSTASGSAIAVNSGGTLAGTGTVGGAVTVASGGTLQAGTPGGATGTLTLSGNLTLASGGNFNAVINSATPGSGYDQVVVAGTVTLGSATLNLSGSGATSYGNQLILIQNNGSSAISGTFLNLAANAPTTDNGVNYNITYTGGTGSKSAMLVNSSSGETSNTDPFGIGTSAQAMGGFASWAGPMALAGAQWVRNADYWSDVEPTQGTWNWATVNSQVTIAALNGQDLSGLFMYNAPWLSDGYPTGSTELSEFATYVSSYVTHVKGSVEYWEVWNEPESFGPVPATAYASMASTAYTAAKTADANSQIGLSVAENDVNYLETAINTMVAAGNGNDFDYIAVHPYSDLAGLNSPSDPGYEAEYMSIVPTIRKMLAADDPSKANVPIWITEENVAVGGSVTLTTQAQTLVQAYTMNLAQGIARTEYFEAAGNAYNMGLLTSSYTPNPAYYALQSLTTQLGANPTYQGWVQLNANQDYGFVFQGASTTVMSLWAMAGVSENVTFSANVQVENPITQVITPLTAGTQLALTNAPVLILGVPAGLVTAAQANKSQPFPWIGNYSGATSVSMVAGEPNSDSGLHQMSADGSSVYAGIVNGQPARNCNQNVAGSGTADQCFTVDPNFLSYTHDNITITAAVCLLPGASSAGFNLKYESSTGWASIGWNSVTATNTWQTMTWTLTADEFNGIWGYNFRFDSDSSANSKYYLDKVTITRNGDSQVSLASSYNDAGQYTNGQTFSSTGGLDGAGNAYSATALGSSVTNQGTSFALGTANSNNVVNATGQTITLTSGKYSALTFLGAATGGSQSGTFTVNYSDGTHQTFTQGMSNWLSGSSAAGEIVADTMTYYNLYNGTSPTQTTYLYQYTFALNAAKTVSSITLPNNSNIHLLAIDLLP